jgi:hypothetical protein
MNCDHFGMISISLLCIITLLHGGSTSPITPARVMSWCKSGIRRERGIELNDTLTREMHQQGLQTVCFGLQRWRQFAEDIGADPSTLFDDDDILDMCEHLIERKTGDAAHSLNNEDAMLELFADAASITSSAGEFSSPSQEYVAHREHYTIVNQHTDESAELRVHLKSALPELSRYIRDYGIDHSLYQRSDYYRWFKTSADDPDSKVLSETVRTYLDDDTQRRCVAIDLERLTDELNVHRTDIIPPWERVPSRSDSSDDDTDGDGDRDEENSKTQTQTHPKISALNDITASQPVASTTAMIEFGEYDHTAAGASDDGPAIKATLTDGDTEAKLIAWDADDITLPVDEYGAVSCDEVTVRSVTPDDYQGTLQLNKNRFRVSAVLRSHGLELATARRRIQAMSSHRKRRLTVVLMNCLPMIRLILTALMSLLELILTGLMSLITLILISLITTSTSALGMFLNGKRRDVGSSKARFGASMGCRQLANSLND